MNYFQKNLKFLRKERSLSQEQLAAFFGLSKSNINSYENGAMPKIEMFIQMMDFFRFDPSKFIQLDMEKHSVSRDVDLSEEEKEAQEKDLQYDELVRKHTEDDRRFHYLDQLSVQELKEMYIDLFKSRELVIKENMEVKAKCIDLLENKLNQKK
ncbi:MAG: helix-turn-helix transcriptional regulator [Bacteroidota bacterium]